MNLDTVLRDIVREVIREELASSTVPDKIELIPIKAAAEMCGVGRQVIDDLVKNEASGFPFVRLGPKSTMVDRTRLAAWIRNGGLKSAVDNSNVVELRKVG